MTALPFASNALYVTLTQHDATSSKSPYRIAAEAFSQTLTSSFGIYVFNGLSFYVYTLTAPSFRRELLLLILPRRWAITLRQKEQHQMSLTNRIGPSRLDGTSINLKVMPRNVVATNL
ncbi:unnamed protein product [Rotaria sordida]|uniref:Uncharacterized protein n=1 Tax=Rotaria sordida TaxID=392033 RepID=A0A814VS17_9BILA|nr:unnamed protein product [Rotaria sordida]